MTYTWSFLSQNPSAEAKVDAEIDSVLGGTTATVDDIPKLVYTNKVLAESMRINPPVWIGKRKVVDDVRYGEYLVPKGSFVMLSQYLLHHDSRYFPDPEKFIPERWTSEFKMGLPKTAYFPFGSGLQICLGEPLAWMEATLVIATIAQNWRLELARDAKVELDTKWRSPLSSLSTRSLLPLHSVPIVPHKRR